MEFVNLNDQTAGMLLLEFFDSFMQFITDRGFIPEILYSLKAFLVNYEQVNEVQEFAQKYAEIIGIIEKKNEEGKELLYEKAYQI